MTSSVADYVFDHRIGVGAMGEVWRARTRDGTVVAVKVARPEMRGDPRLHDLVTGEARAMARLDHPHVTWLYDHGRMPEGAPFPAGCPYLVLEHCGGGTLAEHPVSDWAGVRPIVAGLLQALAHAHAHGIVHRDLKPANVLWSDPSDVRPGMKLADFGVAFWMDTGDRTARAGTPTYMAPEQFRRSSEVGPWTDLYALGVVVWELVTGRPPQGSQPLTPRFPVPDGLEEWILGLVEPEPRRRTSHAAHALRDLARVDPEIQAPPRDWRTPIRVGPRLRLQGAGLGLLALREPELAGRHEERAALWETLERTLAEQTVHSVVLRGVSGIGKSRLCGWLAERVAELGVAEPVVVACRDDATLPRVLAALFGVRRTGPARPAAIRAAVASHGPDVARRIDALLADPSVRWGTVPAVHELLRDEARHRPRVLILDDAHQSIDALRLAAVLAADRVNAPLLVVVAVEDQADGDRNLDALVRHARVLPLGPMSPADQEELLWMLVGLDPESHAAALARSGGHPGYVVAQVTSWAQRGVLVAGQRGFRPAKTIDEADSWSSIWARRLSEWTLGPDDEVLLERAAVLGRTVDEALWECACDDPEATMGVGSVRIDRAAARRRALLVERLLTGGLADETDDGFRFTHPAVVDVLLERARASGRLREHHRACANQLRRFGRSAALRLGRHLAQAELWEEAVPALASGIRFAWSRQDRRPLLTDLEQARTCADRAGWPSDDPRRWELHHLRGLLLLSTGRADEGATESLKAIDLARRTGVRLYLARAILARMDILGVSHRFRELAELVPEFLRIEDETLEPHWAGMVRVRYGKWLRQLGDADAARRWFAAAEEKLLHASDPDDLQVLGTLLELYAARHQSAEIIALSPRMEQAAADSGRIDLRVFAVSVLVEAAKGLGRHDEAIAHGERALRLNEGIGDDRFLMFMRAQLADSDILSGRPAEALARLDRALDAAGRVENAWLVGRIHLMRGDCHLRLGDLGAYDRDVVALDGILPRLLAADPSVIALIEAMLAWLEERGESARRATLERILEKTRRAAVPNA